MANMMCFGFSRFAGENDFLAEIGIVDYQTNLFYFNAGEWIYKNREHKVVQEGSNYTYFGDMLFETETNQSLTSMFQNTSIILNFVIDQALYCS